MAGAGTVLLMLVHLCKSRKNFQPNAPSKSDATSRSPSFAPSSSPRRRASACDRPEFPELETAACIVHPGLCSPDTAQKLLIERGFPYAVPVGSDQRVSEHPNRFGRGAWMPRLRARPEPGRPFIDRVSLRPRRSIVFWRRGSRRSKGNGRSVSNRISGSGGAASMESSPAISLAAFSRMASPYFVRHREL